MIAACYKAKAKGVRTGMRLIEARKLVPNAAEMPSEFDEACVASRQIQTIIKSICPVVERYSVDEWFADLRTLVGGDPKDPQYWAEELQRNVLQQTGLTVSVGIGPSKLLSKMASEYRKPAGATVVGDHRLTIEAFLRDRPAEAIPGIGNRRGMHAEVHRWQTAWDIAQAPVDRIKHLYGKPGLEMQLELNGERVHKVDVQSAPPKAVSRCRSFRATTDKQIAFAHLLAHLTRIVLRMRLQKLSCQHVSVWLRDDSYHHSGKDYKLPQPIDNEEMLFPYIRSCFDRAWKDNLRCTQVGLGLYQLKPTGYTQYSLFEAPEQTNDALAIQDALDTLRERYGRDSVVRGAAMALPLDGKKKPLSSYGHVDEVF